MDRQKIKTDKQINGQTKRQINGKTDIQKRQVTRNYSFKGDPTSETKFGRR